MRMTEVKQDVMYVRMLGGFSIQWNGKLIAGVPTPVSHN